MTYTSAIVAVILIGLTFMALPYLPSFIKNDVGLTLLFCLGPALLVLFISGRGGKSGKWG